MTTDYSDDTDGNKPPIPKLPDPESLTPNPYLEADAIGSIIDATAKENLTNGFFGAY